MSTIYIPSGAQGAIAGSGSSITSTISSGAGANGATWYTMSNTASASISSSFRVDSDAEFNGGVTVRGRDLVKMLEKIEDRLAILTPDPVKLAKFEALKKAYDNYKMLEALCQVEDDDSNPV